MLYKKVHRRFLRQFREGKELWYFDDSKFCHNWYGTIIHEPYYKSSRHGNLIVVHAQKKEIALIQDGYIRWEFYVI